MNGKNLLEVTIYLHVGKNDLLQKVYIYLLVEYYALLEGGSVHAKLEAHTTLLYVQCESHI